MKSSTKNMMMFLLLIELLPATSWGNSIDDVAEIKPLVSGRAGTHDPTGNADSVNSFPPAATHVVLDIDGPGQINHLWMTYADFPGHRTLLRDLNSYPQSRGAKMGNV